MTPQEEANRQLIAEFWHYNATGQHDKMIAQLSTDVVFKIGVGRSEGIVPYHGTFHGIEGAKDYLRKARAGRIRKDCAVRPLVEGEQPKPMKAEASPLGLVVQGNTVVGLGEVVETFHDQTLLGGGEILLLFKIDEASKKITLFQLFLDTATPLLAFLHRGHSGHAA